MANLISKLIRDSSFLAPDFAWFKHQESAFLALNLLILTALLAAHTILASYFGTAPRSVIAILAVAVLLNSIEFVWIRNVRFVSAARIVTFTWMKIWINLGLTSTLAALSYSHDTQYFALLAAPVLQAALRFPCSSMVAVLAGTTALEFFWIWNFFRLHPPVQIGEYLEAAAFALVYATAGLLVWHLVNHLRRKNADLERAKERLLQEEKLAAVGRFSSAIAHEIRNPVAMISSALATARNGELGSVEREEMFDIAAKEASRLAQLTTDFLAYARPRPPAKEPGDVAESIAYIADICRPRADAKAVLVRTQAPDGLRAEIDCGQVQQALLNLVMNAIEASPDGAIVLLRGKCSGSIIRVDIESPTGPIPHEAAALIFEPFFTTKPGGTGLGLAIARSIVRAHGGELELSRNDNGLVQFSFTLPAHRGESRRAWAES